MAVDGKEREDEAARAPAWARRPGVRHAVCAFGLVMVGLGVVGIVVPGLPTTIFLIIALWAFSHCSERFHRWLWEHPRLGAPLRDWQRHRVIPMRAKVAAVAVMSLSVAVLAVAAEAPLPAAAVAAILVPIALYILTRPGRAPGA